MSRKDVHAQSQGSHSIESRMGDTHTVFIHCVYTIHPFIPCALFVVGLLTYRLIIVIERKERRRERIQRSSTEPFAVFVHDHHPPYNPICREIDRFCQKVAGTVGSKELSHSKDIR